ncbi:hypothetical protein N431DRAFT_486141 [Stipitochalara longipes BDJ]|nr:hypothetical protein N431DRAFT_486141 [Stipitochalara longipes BDJ]
MSASPFPLPLQLLAVGRIGVGTSAFLFPSLTTNLLFFPQPSSSPGSLFNVRAWGSRDALLGALLLTAKTPEARKRALIAGAVVDGLDVVGAFWGFGKGEMEGMAAGAFSGGAIAFLALAAVGWRVGGLGAVGRAVGKS